MIAVNYYDMVEFRLLVMILLNVVACLYLPSTWGFGYLSSYRVSLIHLAR